MSSGSRIWTMNPATGSSIREYNYHTFEEQEKVLELAQEASLVWGALSFDERASGLKKFAMILQEHRKELSQAITLEVGKVLSESLAEVDKSIFALEYYADQAKAWLSGYDTAIPKANVVWEPYGVILAIMPWNFPVWQVVRASASAWMAGNVIVLKHADNVAGVAAMIEQYCQKAFTICPLVNVRATHNDCERLILNPVIQGVTLTGSAKAGRIVGGLAGQALKKVVLELGGSDPYIVLKDTDLKHAARECIRSRLVNAGQSCVAAKRFIVEKPVAEPFLQFLLAEMKLVTMGDPRDLNVQVGPLAREDLREALERQLEQSRAKGARILLGGVRPGGPGFYYPPTLVSNVTPGMALFEEEVFGPIASVVEADDLAHAIKLANQSKFGLGSAVFTNDRELAFDVARRLKAGLCGVNQMVKSDPRLPFGGRGESGIGLELGREGLFEFAKPKVILC